MPSTTLQALREELVTIRDTLLPQLEGFRDFRDLTLLPGAEAIIVTAITHYEERLARIEVTLAALTALEDHGYPEMPVTDIPQAVYNNLGENLRTLTAAYKQFSPMGEVVSATVTFGDPMD